MLEGTPLSYDGMRLVIGFDSDYEVMQAMTVERELPLLIRRLQALTGESHAVLLLERRSGLATAPQIRKRNDLNTLKSEVSGDPLIQKTVRAFSGRIVDVHCPDEPVDE